MAAPMEPDADPINTARHANIYFAAQHDNTTAQNKLCWSRLIVGLIQQKSLQYLPHNTGRRRTERIYRKNRSREPFKNTMAAALYKEYLGYTWA